jgi:hypothetical protein
MWCYVIWCNDMLQRMMLMPKTHTHAETQSLCPLRNDQNLFAVYFSASPLIFWCKFCIPLGTSFELLRLLFRQHSRWLFTLRLIFRRYLALHSLWNDFWAENLHYAPLGTTFCSFSKLTLRSLGTTFVASVKLAMRFLALHSLRNVFWASAIFELRECVEKIYFTLTGTKLLQEIKTRFTLIVSY